MTWLTAVYHENDTADYNYTKASFQAECTVISHKTALDEMETKYAGFQVRIKLRSLTPKVCNETCKVRIPMWCYSGSERVEQATSNQSKYEMDTIRLPDEINRCLANCSNNALEYRIFAVKPLGFFDRGFLYPKFRNRMAYQGGEVSTMWDKSPHQEDHPWMTEVLGKHTKGETETCYILPHPKSHPSCNRKMIEDQECLDADVHPCRYNQVIWDGDKPEELRGRTYFVATWTTVIWLFFVVGTFQWYTVIAEFYREKYNLIVVFVERMHSRHNLRANGEGADEDLLLQYKQKFFRVLLELLKKVSHYCGNFHVLMQRLFFEFKKKLGLERGDFKIASLDVEDFDDFGENEGDMGNANEVVRNTGTAYRLLNKAKEDQYKVIDLSGLKLKDLSPLLAECTHVTTLILNENELNGSCLELICQSKTLERLHLANNRISSVPITNYLNMERLELLDLDHNIIGRAGLPEQMSTLPCLTKLFLNNNGLTSIPQCVYGMTTLKHLYLNNNNIERVDENIQALTNLCKLSISNNEIENISKSIMCCAKLMSLNLMSNELEVLPDELGCLTALKSLLIGQNSELAELPVSIGNLAELTELDASSCTIRSLPEAILKCTSLVALNFSDNAISYVPRWLQELPPSVELLDLTKNHISNVDAVESHKWLKRRSRRIKYVKFLP